MAWDSRFKQASAARRRAKAGVEALPPRRFDEHAIDEARRVSPEHFLRRHYPVVKVTQSGSTVWVPKILRCDLDDDHWVSCGWEEQPIGDNLGLVQFVMPGTPFPDAIRELTGAEALSEVRHAAPAPAPPAALHPRLPSVAGRDRGRAYLRERGISGDSIRAAEEAGLVRYADSGVIFLGRDLASSSRSVRAATIRYFEVVERDGDRLTKRDFANSNKLFPAVLSGDPCRVLVVESGISGLAARDIVVRLGQPAPTVIVSGGVNTRRWVGENEPVRRVLAGAEIVEIWGEHESGVEKQERTDLLRRKLQAAIAEQRSGELPAIIYPPDGIKDAADWNHALGQRSSSEAPKL